MKKFLALSFSLLTFFGAIADDIDVDLDEGQNTDQPPVENPHRHRMPQRRISCNIDSENGVSIPGVETSEILSFELYDESGELCLASFTNDMDFVSFLFTLEGDYVVRFVTEDKTYSGFISL